MPANNQDFFMTFQPSPPPARMTSFATENASAKTFAEAMKAVLYYPSRTGSAISAAPTPSAVTRRRASPASWPERSTASADPR